MAPEDRASLRREGSRLKTPKAHRDGAGADPQCTGMVPGPKDLRVHRDGAEADPKCTGMVPVEKDLRVHRDGAEADPVCTGMVPGRERPENAPGGR